MPLGGFRGFLPPGAVQGLGAAQGLDIVRGAPPLRAGYFAVAVIYLADSAREHIISLAADFSRAVPTCRSSAP